MTKGVGGRVVGFPCGVGVSILAVHPVVSLPFHRRHPPLASLHHRLFWPSTAKPVVLPTINPFCVQLKLHRLCWCFFLPCLRSSSCFSLLLCSIILPTYLN
ncbi:hypothetical protein L2E82_47209 [Cichorium intybus]|uniref:Uncharacterized protein n=1 Tax=Cichorium intybus TaxID=13427 RepID=A0ACB8YUX9_CICIN|nr:hypothetical protein L2E82_47209 [Cichorium intybus]